MNAIDCDVAIVGGGPAGSTAAALLKKYNSALRVVLIEREVFPREHIGESQLPPIGKVLVEMGVWDKIEAANFIVKLGATYTWGKTTEPWFFGFVPDSEVENNPRPEPHAGWRSRVAMQVDRAIYDDILLKHAESMGCQVLQPAKVSRVEYADDEITALHLEDGRRVTARYFLDCSGNAAVIRRAMQVKVEIPTLLQNVAFWDYWSAPGLNDPIMEKAAIRIQIRSLPYGWVWFIALSRDRTSVGHVCPADYFKTSGMTPEQAYERAISEEAQVSKLLQGARPEGKVRRTNDWSYVASRAHGKNWMLVGESLGFADPILSAGMTLTHTCAQHAAYVILELERRSLPPDWLLETYGELQLKRVRQHMKFAEYWYSGNGQFANVREYCSEIARQSGLKLSPDAAFRWLSNGGVDDHLGTTSIGGADVAGIRGVQWRLSHETGNEVAFRIHGKSVFKLRMDGAVPTTLPVLAEGRIHRVQAFRRGEELLPIIGGYQAVYEALKASSDASEIVSHIKAATLKEFGPRDSERRFMAALMCLELMVTNEWVKTSEKPNRPAISLVAPREGKMIYTLKDL